jgi:hypothetical protein
MLGAGAPTIRFVMGRSGSEGAMSKTRKLAAFADAVGYSRLMGEDELGAAQAVRERRSQSWHATEAALSRRPATG